MRRLFARINRKTLVLKNKFVLFIICSFFFFGIWNGSNNLTPISNFSYLLISLTTHHFLHTIMRIDMDTPYPIKDRVCPYRHTKQAFLLLETWKIANFYKNHLTICMEKLTIVYMLVGFEVHC